jgi:hypothetical protein
MLKICLPIMKFEVWHWILGGYVFKITTKYSNSNIMYILKFATAYSFHFKSVKKVKLSLYLIN